MFLRRSRLDHHLRNVRGIFIYKRLLFSHADGHDGIFMDGSWDSGNPGT